MSKRSRLKRSNVEIDLERLLVENGFVDEYYYLDALKQRKLFLEEEISQETVSEIVKHILRFNKEDEAIPVAERKPIILYLSSNGGDVDPGFELIDVILHSKTPVYTVNLGYWYSMGFLIGIAGHKRYASSNSKCLMHDGSQFIYNSGSKVQDQLEFQKKIEARVKRHVLNCSKLTEEEYNGKLRVEWYLFADEAKEKGFIDYIIGEDCELDEII